MVAMEPAQIAEHARRLGIRLTIEGGLIAARPKGTTPPDLAQAIREHKPALIKLLHLQTEQADSQASDGRTCYRCGYRVYDAERVCCPACEAELGSDRGEAERIARLDAERREADRQAGRGYDVDCSAPGPAAYLARAGQRCCTCQISAEEHRAREIDRLARTDGWTPTSPAPAIIEVCRQYGVALRIDHDGAPVVGEAGAKADEATQPWASLIMAIEAHLETVARLVASGWRLRATFPDDARIERLFSISSANRK